MEKEIGVIMSKNPATAKQISIWIFQGAAIPILAICLSIVLVTIYLMTQDNSSLIIDHLAKAWGIIKKFVWALTIAGAWHLLGIIEEPKNLKSNLRFLGFVIAFIPIFLITTG